MCSDLSRFIIHSKRIKIPIKISRILVSDFTDSSAFFIQAGRIAAGFSKGGSKREAGGIPFRTELC
ncbi:hypothetical protein NPIL_148301 [Nephila pilipes]|uniref:Uncharacterized protein n=1 Tax=Nephila pilipes TaxID=299642 RepID=A0A8X6UED8_NEPPI|nr:hypothetical protein NPIL_148301 [Nephila pilipes]